MSVGAGLITDVGIGESETITTMPDFADDTVLIVLTHEASLKFIDYTPADFPEIECTEIEDLSTGKGAKVQAVLRGEQLDMDSIGARFMNQNIDVDGFHRILSLKLANPGKGNVLRATAALEQREDVYSAEPNYIIQGIEPQAVVLPEELPPYGWAANKIQQEAAWEIETGSSSVLVGVVDSGIDQYHPELKNKVHKTLSKDFLGDGFTALEDPYGHGTHIAGIIGAKYNNDYLNFSGVCQNVKLVSLRVLNRYNNTHVDAVIDAIDYADKNDIPILNLSIHPVGGGDPLNLMQSVNNYSGLAICAIGNQGGNADVYGGSIPAMWAGDNIVSVGASTQNDTICEFSNYGEESVDLFAPGDNILSCYPEDLCSTTNCTVPGHARYGYHYMSGTSMATPFVTGVAALIIAHNPDVTSATIKSMILDGVDEINAFSGKCVTGGRLNAYNALT